MIYIYSLTLITSNLLSKLNNNNGTILTLLDIFSGSNTLNHNILFTDYQTGIT